MKAVLLILLSLSAFCFFSVLSSPIILAPLEAKDVKIAEPVQCGCLSFNCFRTRSRPSVPSQATLSVPVPVAQIERTVSLDQTRHGGNIFGAHGNNNHAGPDFHLLFGH